MQCLEHSPEGMCKGSHLSARRFFCLKYACMECMGATGIPTFCGCTGPTDNNTLRWRLRGRSMSVFYAAPAVHTSHLSRSFGQTMSFMTLARHLKCLTSGKSPKDCHLLCSFHKTRPKDFPKRKKTWVGCIGVLPVPCRRNLVVKGICLPDSGLCSL